MYRWAKLAVELLNGWAWPIVALVAIFLLRPHVRTIIHRISSMKAMGVEVSLAEASEELAKADFEAGERSGEAPVSGISIPEQVTASWLVVEALVAELSAKHGITGRRFGEQLLTLRDRGILSPHLTNSLVTLRSVRHGFLHREADMSTSQAIAFTGLLEQISERLRELLSKPRKHKP
jgi:hypothetical protein